MINQAELKECKECKRLCEVRDMSKNERAKFPVGGSPSTPVNKYTLVIGEAPGKGASESGITFPDNSGTILRMFAIASNIRNPYYTNAVKCRPPFTKKNQSSPSQNEINNCSNKWLIKELFSKRIFSTICVGSTSSSAVLGLLNIKSKEPLEKTQGFFYHEKCGTILFTYHPSGRSAVKSAIDTLAKHLIFLGRNSRSIEMINSKQSFTNFFSGKNEEFITKNPDLLKY